MNRMRACVQCYSGYKADERPVRFQIGAREYVVSEVVDRWYGPHGASFRVCVEDGEVFLLRQCGEEWDVEGPA